MKNYKYLIVGQGIAGTLVAMECIKRDISFVVIDLPSLSRASKVAAGIINPITGRKFVKTWMYEQLEQAFLSTYQAFEILLGGNYLQKKEIVRAIHKVADQNNWDARSQSEDASTFMNSEVDISDFHDKIHVKLGYGKVKGYQLNIAQLVSDFRTYLAAHDLVKELAFDFADLIVNPEEVRYKDLKAKAVIFCEGYKVTENPYFGHLPFAPAKGELLIVKIPSLKTEMLIKDQVFICPIKDEIFWVGATYGWDDLTDEPTLEKKKWLVTALEKVISVPFEVQDHLAGVRPATKFRKPFIGSHSVHQNIHLYNGLGTKGSSLGPYWANHFLDHLEDGLDLSPEVDIANIL